MISPRAPAIVVVDLDHAWADVFVPEPTVPQIKIGQPATVFTDAGGPGLTGTITYISPKAEFTPRNVQTAEERSKLVYRVRINVDNKDGVLKQGMPVEAEIRARQIAMAAIEFQNVVKRYGKVEALRGVTFSVERGEMFGLIGPDGAGKTTAIRAICGLLHVDAGSIRVLGQGSGQAAPRRHRRRSATCRSASRSTAISASTRTSRSSPRSTACATSTRGAIACSR